MAVPARGRLVDSVDRWSVRKKDARAFDRGRWTLRGLSIHGSDPFSGPPFASHAPGQPPAPPAADKGHSAHRLGARASDFTPLFPAGSKSWAYWHSKRVRRSVSIGSYQFEREGGDFTGVSFARRDRRPYGRRERAASFADLRAGVRRAGPGLRAGELSASRSGEGKPPHPIESPRPDQVRFAPSYPTQPCFRGRRLPRALIDPSLPKADSRAGPEPRPRQTHLSSAAPPRTPPADSYPVQPPDISARKETPGKSPTRPAFAILR